MKIKKNKNNVYYKKIVYKWNKLVNKKSLIESLHYKNYKSKAGVIKS